MSDRISETQKNLIIEMYKLNLNLVSDGKSAWLTDSNNLKLRNINIRTVKSMARNDLIRNISDNRNIRIYVLSNTSLSLFN